MRPPALVFALLACLLPCRAEDRATRLDGIAALHTGDRGIAGGRVFRRGQPPVEVSPGDILRL